MANISLTIRSDFEQAERDFRELMAVSEQARAKFDKMQQSFKTENIDKFMARNRLNAVAIRATQGSVAALSAETAGLQREIQRLIRAGLSPEDEAVRKLRTEYARLSAKKGKISGPSLNPASLLNYTAAIGGLYTVMYAGRTAWNAFIEPAMQAEEAASKFNTIFGQQAEAVRLWADAYGSEIGRSSRALQGFAADMMAIVSPLGVTRTSALEMSEGLVRAAQDLSSFHNVDVSEAFNALRSGITGETEPLKRFSILLTDAAMQEHALSRGITKKISEMSTAEKTTLRYNMILASMGAAQNDAARTAGSTTNRLRALSDQIDDLQVAIGSALLPALNETLNFFMDNDSVLNRYNATVNNVVNQIGSVVAALAELAWSEGADAASGFGDSVGAIWDKLEPVRAVLGDITSGIGDFIAETQLAQTIVWITEEIGDGFSWIGRQADRVDWGNIFSGQFIVNANNAAQAVRNVNANLSATQQAAAQAQGALMNVATRGYNAILGSLQRVDQQHTQSAVRRSSDRARDLEQRVQFEQQWVDRVRQSLMEEDELRQYSMELRLANNEIEYERALAQAQRFGADRTNIDAYYSRQQIRIQEEESEKRTREYIGYAQTMVGNTHSMFQDIHTVMQNFGKEAKGLTYILKALAMAEAAINSYLAFTDVLADKSIWPTWARLPIAATILAAGLAKQAAIASTPISAETGITNYTVPEIRTNRNDNAPVMASAGEQVTVTPRGETAESTTSVNIQIGEDTLFRVVQRGISTGKININNRNIGRSVFMQ